VEADGRGVFVQAKGDAKHAAFDVLQDHVTGAPLLTEQRGSQFVTEAQGGSMAIDCPATGGTTVVVRIPLADR
jgi:hypothetical protein